jgi:hypothetical protein
MEETMNKKLLGLQTDNHINWKNHKEKMISKSSELCYAIRSMVRISNINTLKSVYYVYFHSIIKYGMIFTFQNKIVRIMDGAQLRTSCKNPFKQLTDSTCSMPIYTLINKLHY